MAEIIKSDEEARYRMAEAIRKIGLPLMNEEWEYFQEYARNFKQTEKDPNKQYGILIMNSAPLESNMIYAKDPLHLRTLHLEALAEGKHLGLGHQVRRYLDWLERIERKS